MIATLRKFLPYALNLYTKVRNITRLIDKNVRVDMNHTNRTSDGIGILFSKTKISVAMMANVLTQ